MLMRRYAFAWLLAIAAAFSTGNAPAQNLDFPDIDLPDFRLPTPPCAFDWSQLRLPNGSIRNFTTEAEEQPFQGPCMSFAVTAAIEAMYEIENNRPFRNLDLSQAHLDYFVFPSPNVKPAFDGGYRIPTSSCGNFPPRCTDEFNDCPIQSDVKEIIDYPYSCFDISLRVGADWNLEYQVEEESNQGVNWFGVSSVTAPFSVESKDELKHLIMDKGPVIVSVINSTEEDYLSRFVNYHDSSEISYHAFLIIGWEDDDAGNTRWRLIDSWPGAAGYKYSRPNPGVDWLSQSSRVSFTQLEGIYLGDSSPGTTPVEFDPADQCQRGPVTPELHGVTVDEPNPQVNQWYTAVASTHCETDIAEWEFETSGVAVETGSENPDGCNYSISLRPLSSGTLTVRARAKSTDGLWSDWASYSVEVGGIGPY